MFEREENPSGIKKADIVVGLASYNEADSIAYPTEQAGLGLKKHYPDQSCAIVNCDNYSPDNTEKAFMGVSTPVPKIYVTTPPDTPGKGYNFENMFRKFMELDGKVLVCLDADLLSVTPEWVKYFADPVLKDYDFVNPVYSRHKYDGTITNNICFPLVYGLLCRNIRQPIGGDFALSADLVRYLICQRWHRTTEEYGVDIFMTLNSILGGFKNCNTGLGAKIHKPSAPKLGPMFIQVVSTAFYTIIRNFEKWKGLSKVQEPELFGLQKMDPPQDLSINRSDIEKKAMECFLEYEHDLENVLSADLFKELKNQFDKRKIDINSEQWVHVVYDMVSAFKKSTQREQLVDSLKGLYFGRALSFMNKTWDLSTEDAEQEILAQAKVFYDNRGYLISKLQP